MQIDSFRDEYAFLSNFYHAPVLFEGVTYPTVEHAFQAAKTLDPKMREMILKAGSPSQAKKIGQTVTLRYGWGEVRVPIMVELLRSKFSNPVLAKQLVDTGDAELIEGNNWHDVFWGVHLPTGEGQNMLGKLLMQIRSVLKLESRVFGALYSLEERDAVV